MSEVRFPLSTPGGRLVFEAGGDRVLLASASPVTVAQRASWNFLGRSWPVVAEHAGLDVGALEEGWGLPFDVLLGGNVLTSYAVSIERATASVGFASGGGRSRGKELPLVYFMGIPMIDVTVDGRPARLFVDTASRLSFLDPRRLDGVEIVGRDRDVVPGAGRIDTPMRACEVDFGGERAVLHFGECPEALAAMLAMGMAHGVLGTEILATHDVTLDGPADRLVLTALSLAR